MRNVYASVKIILLRSGYNNECEREIDTDWILDLECLNVLRSQLLFMTLIICNYTAEKNYGKFRKVLSICLLKSKCNIPDEAEECKSSFCIQIPE